MDFGTRVFKEHKTLCAAARRLGVPAQDVEDLVSATMVRALELADRYDEQGTLRAWLITVLRGLVLNDRRMAQTRRTVLTAFSDEEHGHEVWREAVRSPAAQESEIAAAEALEVIAGLPQDWRDVIEAVTIGGISYADYAAARGLTLGTVKSRLSRALGEVRARLGAAVGRTASARSGSAAGAAGTAGARRKRQDNRTDCSEAAALVIGGTASGVPAAAAAQDTPQAVSRERSPLAAPRALSGMTVTEGANAPERQGEFPSEDRDNAARDYCLNAAVAPEVEATRTSHAQGSITPEHRNGATPDRRITEAGEQAPGVPPIPQRAEGPGALADRRVHDLQRLLAAWFGAREGAGSEAAANAAPPASARQDSAKVAPDHVSAAAPEHGSAAFLDRRSGARAEHGAAASAERENAGAGDPEPAVRPSSRQAA